MQLVYFFRQLLLLLLLAAYVPYSFAVKENGDVHFVAGLKKPPFIIEENLQGLQIDIIREALTTQNLSVQFSHMPLGRNITGYQRLNADAVSLLPQGYKYPGMFLSKPYIAYQNVAVSLAHRDFTIDSIDGLASKSIVAFQNAKKFISEDFEKRVSYSLDYREVANQKQQIAMLFSGAAEVIILDVNILKYFLKNESQNASMPVNIHYIFDERIYVAGFKSEELKQSFDLGIDTLKEQGTYQLILDKYLNP